MKSPKDDAQFRIRQAGILVNKPFDSEGAARAWAEWNYRGTDWEIVPPRQPVSNGDRGDAA